MDNGVSKISQLCTGADGNDRRVYAKGLATASAILGPRNRTFEGYPKGGRVPGVREGEHGWCVPNGVRTLDCDLRSRRFPSSARLGREALENARRAPVVSGAG